ncbi:DedA family protein [Amycolatopsis sp. 195334CR]|uniref:DedA family protein n=1 Tax=Amycolatopsis sp. 195334CR TaxID=2814588 RepID=UPI001A8DA200|nr:VTT domain-containing protein [Amycolatopsis sp. 195334CR]MBN6035996.1 VTT domain-containing protein [Amycolatopsis sp. 195334CR]
MLDLLNSFAELVSGALGSPWLWVLVFFVSALDALLPFMPSETTVLTVAVLLGQATGSLVALAVLAAAGALAGDCLSHAIGRRAGPRALARLQRGDRGRRRYEWVRDKLVRHGTTLIIAGRYLPGGRVAVGLATGSLRYPLRRFVALDALGASIWAVYSVLVGYLGGAAFAGNPAMGLLVAFGIGLATVGVVELARRRYARRRASLDQASPT